MSLMLIHGELETIARISECFGLLINGGFIAMEFILRIFCWNFYGMSLKVRAELPCCGY